MTSTVKDRETGVEVDLDGLTDEEMLFCIYLASVHPDYYDGKEGYLCLRGWSDRVNRETYAHMMKGDSALRLSDNVIYHRVTKQEDQTNAVEALGIAATALGVDMQEAIDTYAERAGYYPRLARQEEFLTQGSSGTVGGWHRDTLWKERAR